MSTSHIFHDQDDIDGWTQNYVDFSVVVWCWSFPELRVKPLVSLSEYPIKENKHLNFKISHSIEYVLLGFINGKTAFV